MPGYAQRAPQLIGSSQSTKATVIRSEIEAVETADRTPLYRMRFELGGERKPLLDLVVEYEILDKGGDVLGGGSFTVDPDMIEAGGGALTAMVGFSGIEIEPGHLVIARLIDEPKPGRTKQFTDTCTTFCDKCAEKTNICTNGVVSYDCSYSDSFRHCKFTCRGRPQI